MVNAQWPWEGVVKLMDSALVKMLAVIGLIALASVAQAVLEGF